MHRFLIATLLCLGLVSLASRSDAQYIKVIAGYLPAGKTDTFYPRVPNNSALDTLYRIGGTYSIAGTLNIMEGAEVEFMPNSRIIDSSGGSIIANGFTGLQRRILFRGQFVNSASVEWGHFLILPGAAQTLFANCRFTKFRKDNTVDNKLIYGSTAASDISNSIAITNMSNGVGACITTFSALTEIYDAIVDSCQTSFRGGAFAFMQAPLQSYFPNDDGRIALQNSHVRRLTIRDTRAYNTHAADPNTYGGAIYMSSRTETLTPGYFVAGFLGNRPGPFFPASQDVMVFERCTANNTIATAGELAKGGAIYVGSNTALTLNSARFTNDSAIAASGDLNSWGGAVAVHRTSLNPNFQFAGAGIPLGADRLPGLAVIRQATFDANVAGLGGAIHLDFPQGGLGPALNVDAENKIAGVRDSGLIQFINNVAYRQGGAVWTGAPACYTGYLAPQNFNWPGGSRVVELRVRFMNNVAGVAGGSIFMSPAGTPDIQNRRVWHEMNSVNPLDSRVNRPALTTQVLGGGAEYLGLRDSTFSTEYHGNFTIGGNGGAVCMNEPAGFAGVATVNRYFVEDGYNAQNVTLTPIPSDPRELTRFCDNHAYLGSSADSTVLYQSRGRGGALYINITTKTNPNLATDSTFLSRVRFEKNWAFTGSAIHSDNYNLRLLANLCLVANNHTTSPFGATPDTVNSGNPGDPNASATIWADFEGALPTYETNSRGNAIYDNTARYILRLPVAPFVGLGGTDTIRGNFWGDTGPNLITQIQPPFGAQQSTWFLDYYRQGCIQNVYEPNRNPPTGYTPFPIGQIPDTLLMEGRVYDLLDRGTDMKIADVNNRRLAPSEDFALGIPNDVAKLHRFTRNIFDTNAVYINKIDLLQTDMTGPHPIGYPLFLQGDVDIADSNRDACARDYSVVFVFNSTTNEFVRVNMKETVVDEAASATQQTYQGRLDFVPDSSVASRNSAQRAKTLYTLSLLRPQTMSFFEIQRASKLEDSAALDGRRYSLDPAQYMGSGADSVCVQGINGASAWYAGERYHTLPVRPGDRILVISRTHLWKYGASGAIARGLQFVIGDVTAPSFVSDIPNLATDPINPNRRFIREDENYDSRDLAHTLFRIGGYDPNNFYDPRFLFSQLNYTQLSYNVGIDVPHLTWNDLPRDSAGVRLFKWLGMTTIFNQNVSGSNGYILLSGQPHNPDVVPSGEGLTVKVTNFPPNAKTEGGLLDPAFLSQLGPDSLMLSMWTFPPYMNCPTGFQADTLCVRSTSQTYKFRIFVQDSLPVFTSNPATACAANLTDSLRYTYDIETDDETEDMVAETQGWDFRYGRTSYKFVERPSWLNSVDGSTAFASHGLIDLRIDSALAIVYLKPIPQVNGELNLDTMIAVQAHDGHMGLAVQKWRIPVNVEPTILTTSLLPAKEDVDYSFDFRDTSKVRRILITDPNFADYHTFRLLYKGTSDSVYRDAHYHTGGAKLEGTTPAWLKIDQFSGVLYGTPGANDAPHEASAACDTADVVTVIVQDQCGLTAWKTLQLDVDSTNHRPAFFKGPRTICVTNKQQFCDSVQVTDRDLRRTGNCTDTLEISVLEPASFTAKPSTIGGTLANDTTKVAICGIFNEDDTYFSTNPPPPRYLRLKVRDRAGNEDTVTYRVYVGDVPTFNCWVDVSNLGTSTHPTDVQHLCFGAGRFGTDGLDIRYCEFEIPPTPVPTVFDSRWELPIGGDIKGTYLDIRRDTNQFANVTWQLRLNAGSDGGSFYFPAMICWSRSCMDSANKTSFKGEFYLRHPFNPAEFSIDMRTGQGAYDNSSYTLMSKGADTMCLVIRDVKLANALIVFVPPKSDVAPTATNLFALEQNYPNPFNPSTTVNFHVAERSDVTIELYDLSGALVKTLVHENLEPGSYPVTWDGSDAYGTTMPSGNYICTMTAGTFSSSIKMTLKK